MEKNQKQSCLKAGDDICTIEMFKLMSELQSNQKRKKYCGGAVVHCIIYIYKVYGGMNLFVFKLYLLIQDELEKAVFQTMDSCQHHFPHTIRNQWLCRC